MQTTKAKQNGTRVSRGGLSKDRILAVATRMFSERGFSAISIRDIAGECGISIPSIYHFYGDKESLYHACYQATFEAAAATLRGAFSDGDSPEQQVRRFAEKLCQIFLENHDFRRLLQRELLREERRHIDELTTHHFQHEFRMLTENIALLVGPGAALERAFSIYALTFGLIQLRRIGELAGMDKSIAQSPASLADHVLQIVLPDCTAAPVDAPARTKAPVVRKNTPKR